jgi:hypothetical protein
MKKLMLDPEGLRVESFRTAGELEGAGTVQAQSYTVSPYPSCARTCGASPPADTSLCRDGAMTLNACCV